MLLNCLHEWPEIDALKLSTRMLETSLYNNLCYFLWLTPMHIHETRLILYRTGREPCAVFCSVLLTAELQPSWQAPQILKNIIFPSPWRIIFIPSSNEKLKDVYVRVTHHLAYWCFDLAFDIAHWDLRNSAMTLWGKVNRVCVNTRQF